MTDAPQATPPAKPARPNAFWPKIDSETTARTAAAGGWWAAAWISASYLIGFAVNIVTGGELFGGKFTSAAEQTTTEVINIVIAVLAAGLAWTIRKSQPR